LGFIAQILTDTSVVLYDLDVEPNYQLTVHNDLDFVYNAKLEGKKSLHTVYLSTVLQIQHLLT